MAINRSNSFSLELREIDIIEDMVNSLGKSEYKDDFTVKGGFALLYQNEFRVTGDLDLSWERIDKWEEFIGKADTIFNSSQKYVYEIVKIRGVEKTGFSDSITLLVNGIKRVKIDMNLETGKIEVDNRVTSDGVEFNSYSLETMLADKLSVLATEKICRRIKDIVDIYNISFMKDFILDDMIKISREKGRTDFVGKRIYFLSEESLKSMEHAYDKFKGVSDKIEFEKIMSRVIEFSLTYYKSFICKDNGHCVWNKERGKWIDSQA